MKKILLYLPVLLLILAGVAGATTSVSLMSVTPTSGQAGVTTVSLTASGFTSAASTANVAVSLSGTQITPATVAMVGGSIRRVAFVLPAGTQPGAYTVQIVDPTSNASGFASSTTKPFTVIAPAAIALLPTSGTQGQSVPVTITGSNTTFISGITTASFPAGSGITVSGLTVTSATTATANLVIASSAAAASDTLTVTTGQQVETASFTVNATGYSVSGHVKQVGAGPLAGVTLTLAPGVTTTSLADGSYSFSGVANGTYTLTAAYTDPGGGTVTIFPIAGYSVVVSGANVAVQDFDVTIGYTVSGTLKYAGAKNQTSQAYIALVNPNCPNCQAPGTSVQMGLRAGSTTPVNFAIQGVQPGQYILKAYFDSTGYGPFNVNDPSYGYSPVGAPFSVSNANVSLAAVSLTDAAPVNLAAGSAPTVIASKIANGVVLYVQPLTVGGVEQALGYNVGWSDQDATPGSDSCKAIPTFGGSLYFSRQTQIYAQASSIVILDGNNHSGQFYKQPPAGHKPFSGQSLNFCVSAVAAGGSLSPNTVINETLAAVPHGDATGTTYPISVTVTNQGTGPLYAGCFDPVAHHLYAVSDESATGGPYTVNVPATNCQFFGASDQDNDGLLTPQNVHASLGFSTTGDVYNFGRDMQLVAVNGSTPSQTVDLGPYSTNGYPGFGSSLLYSTGDNNAVLTTQAISDPSHNVTYGLSIDEHEALKVPVSTELQLNSLSAPPGPALFDIALCPLAQCAEPGEFNYVFSTGTAEPQVGDTYWLQINSETSGVVDAPQFSVTGVNTNFATGLSAAGGATPTFSWLGSGPYTYRFTLTDANGNLIWQIPQQNLFNCPAGGSYQCFPAGFLYQPDGVTPITSITWPNDPTGIPNPPQGTLTSGTTYIWSVTTIDSNGNMATQKQVYQP